MKNILIFIAGALTLLAVMFGWNYYSKHYRYAETYQSLGESLSKGMLRDAVMSAETYKLVFGFYPASIDELRSGFTQIDPALKQCKCQTDYYYQLTDDKNGYYLFSKGRDCLAFTSDDIYPNLSEQQLKNIGWQMPPKTIKSQEHELCNGT